MRTVKFHFRAISVTEWGMGFSDSRIGADSITDVAFIYEKRTQYARVVRLVTIGSAREPLQKPAAMIVVYAWRGGLLRRVGGMKQLTLATVGFERYAKTTRRSAFLAEMERVVP
jgi:hypothetical protein